MFINSIIKGSVPFNAEFLDSQEFMRGTVEMLKRLEPVSVQLAQSVVSGGIHS